MELLFAFGVFQIGTIIYAFYKERDRFLLRFFQCVIGGAIGTMVAFLRLTTPKPEQPLLGEAGVEGCPHCGTTYRLSDFRENAAILCLDCRQRIRDAPV